MPGRLATTAMPAIRKSLLTAGRRLSPKALANLRSVLSYLELGAWLETEQDNARPPDVPADVDLFAMAVERVRGQRPLYLEFGVYQGRSFRWWLEHLPAPEARFIGFDSFEGLPEGWRPSTPKGHFATGGPPQVEDDRASFVAGWFDQTLTGWQVPEHDQLVVNIDCDLYSSTDVVLRHLEPHLVPGTLVYFDELPDRDHEMRALLESLARTGSRVRPLATARGGVHWLFEYV